MGNTTGRQADLTAGLRRDPGQEATPVAADEGPPFVSREIFDRFTAGIIGRVDGLEALITLLLADRRDLDTLARAADAYLLEREAHTTRKHPDARETLMESHEMARVTVHGIIANARTRFWEE